MSTVSGEWGRDQLELNRQNNIMLLFLVSSEGNLMFICNKELPY